MVAVSCAVCLPAAKLRVVLSSVTPETGVARSI